MNNENGRYHPLRLNPPMPDDNWPYRDHPTTPRDPEFGIKNPKFERQLFIRRDQMFYDINAQIAMVSRMRKKDDGTEDDALSNATVEFAPQFNRWINEALGIAKGVMSAFVLEKFRDTAMNAITETEEETITLLMPEWYDDTVFPQLVEAVHTYVVEATLARFFQLTFTSKDPVTIDKIQAADDAINNVRKYVNAAKPGRIRKIQKPF